MNKSPLTKLKKLFKHYKINGYIVPSTDEYMSEYTPAYAKRLEYITGFSGSNGLAIILENNALFFTDGRYLEQSKHQLDNDIFHIFDQKDLATFRWQDFIKNDAAIIGYDPKLFTPKMLSIFASLKLQAVGGNLIDQIWSNQPSKPNSQIYIYPEEFAGQSYSSKVSLCRQVLTTHYAEAMVITATDSICWLLNIRAADIPCSPLCLSIIVLTQKQLYFFVEPSRISKQVIAARSEIEVLPEEQLPDALASIKGKILLDEHFTSSFIIGLLKKQEIQKIDDPCGLPKACKNDIEIKHAINGHIKDAVAVCEFLAYLSEEAINHLTEYDLSLKLTEFRKQQAGYVMDSFPTICGFKENGAIIHYNATKERAKKLVGQGLLLIDSGGQYMGATTDITRTIAIEEPTKDQRERYMQVLKGHIALSMIKFPSNTTGANLDVLARQFLWQDGVDYAHGTGHGVGSFLGVHEGPQSISFRSNVRLQLGMILSNEPGYYKLGEFGIRLENLMYIQKADHLDYMQFETLTLVPYDRNLIDFELLTTTETAYIRSYYQKIHTCVLPLLSPTAKKWLISETAWVLSKTFSRHHEATKLP